MSLAFLAKKSWHTSNLRNVEKVWIAEQKHAAEEKKLAELKKNLEEERQMQELRKLQAAHGNKSAAVERLDWMYQGPMASSANDRSAEEYLLGKELKGEEVGSDARKLDGSAYGALAMAKPALPSNDAFSRLNEDPMMLIRSQQKRAQEDILKNPVKMKRIKGHVEKILKDKKEKKKAKKAKKKERKHAKSKRERSFSEESADMDHHGNSSHAHSRSRRDGLVSPIPREDRRSRSPERSTRRDRSRERSPRTGGNGKTRSSSRDRHDRRSGRDRHDRRSGRDRHDRRSDRDRSPVSLRSRSRSRGRPRPNYRCRSSSQDSFGREAARSRSPSPRHRPRHEARRRDSTPHHARKTSRSPERHSRTDTRVGSGSNDQRTPRRRSDSPESKRRHQSRSNDIRESSRGAASHGSSPSRREYTVKKPDDGGKYGLIRSEGAIESKDVDRTTLGPNTKFLEKAREKKRQDEEELRHKLSKSPRDRSALSREEMMKEAARMAEDAKARELYLAKRAAEKRDKLNEQETKLREDPDFLKKLQDDAYLKGESSMEDRLRRNSHYIQKRAGAGNFLSKD